MPKTKEKAKVTNDELIMIAYVLLRESTPSDYNSRESVTHVVEGLEKKSNLYACNTHN
jgi:hypothetical protein